MSAVPVWLLLRGLSRSAAHWGELPMTWQAALRRAVHPQARVVCLDLPGNGRRWRERSPVRVEALADDLRQQWQALRPTLHDDAGQPLADVALHLLALSMGGMVALAWARRWPDELSRIVLVNSSLGGLAPLHWRMRPSAWPTLIRLLALPASDRACEEALFTLTSQRPALRTSAVNAWITLRRAEPVSRANVLRQLIAAARFRLGETADLSASRVPLQVICSAADALVDPRSSRRLADAAGAPLLRHPDAGHDLALDDPAWLIEALLASIRPSGPPHDARPAWPAPPA
ncbi:alpha/beta fold hydrolase [Sphaerotilus mobilis]|uniref:Alpha-beta hydrolase superfamily lysophospholipase n=1 Tax=Sphaerotilus mobilis TaxID=47994 RepID=A0A4Q7LEB1_9BURK|nr:alpha/beta fold hydrolase [Sphaerotilus mobilis]RZS52283.1 alpha-beta hydrolase superfamily lysophospholipase [Sphaerotilus mobilis]